VRRRPERDTTSRSAVSGSLRGLLLLLGVGTVGAAGTFLVGAAVGMHAGELVHLGLLIVPALVATVVVTAVAGRILAATSMRTHLLVVALAGAALGLGNLAALSRTMFVSSHDATAVAVLLCYSVGIGVGAAIALARSSIQAVDRVTSVARSWADGDLDHRIGSVTASAEIERLAATLDSVVDRLQSAIAREREAEGERRDLITAVSHDLRTPLAGLRAMVEALDDGVVNDLVVVRRYTGEMRRAVESLAGLVDDLFELVQLDARHGPADAGAGLVALNEIVRTALRACSIAANDAGVHVSTNLDGAGGAPVPPRLERVVQNLLQNAIQHTPPSGSVCIRATVSNGWLSFDVIDTGTGIAPDMLPRVFEPFWRADAARSSPGSGLGLALAKKIVDAIGGRLDVQSTPGTGSRFTVRLPVA